MNAFGAKLKRYELRLTKKGIKIGANYHKLTPKEIKHEVAFYKEILIRRLKAYHDLYIEIGKPEPTHHLIAKRK